MQLTILPEDTILYRHKPRLNEILISIREPLQVDLIPFGSFAHIYHLKIHDLAAPVLSPPEQLRPVMSLQQAIHLLNFVHQYWQNVEHWTIHFQAGISRSPAIAMALSDVYDGHPSSMAIRAHYPHFNAHVYHLILKAANSDHAFSFHPSPTTQTHCSDTDTP